MNLPYILNNERLEKYYMLYLINKYIYFVDMFQHQNQSQKGMRKLLNGRQLPKDNRPILNKVLEINLTNFSIYEASFYLPRDQ